jgi:hypothetical protein
LEVQAIAGMRRLPLMVTTVVILGALGVGLTVWPPAIPLTVVVLLALVGIRGSNFLKDRGFPSTLSRRFAPAVGGLAYLVSVVWLDLWVAVLVSGAMTVLIAALRLGFRDRLRGIRGSHSAQAWAEITYPLAGTVSLYIGWGLMGNRWLGFLPIAFMAWGDTAAGLTRDLMSRDRAPTALSMAAMLLVCLGATAVFFRPIWIGAVGAVCATLAERYRPGVLGFWDDNGWIVVTSLALMGTLLRFFG